MDSATGAEIVCVEDVVDGDVLLGFGAILISTLLTVALTALFLGGPLALATWQLVEDFTRAELTQRLEQVTETVDPERAEWFAAGHEAGTIFQNRCDYLDPALPWTGVRDSGKGSTLSRHGFHHLTRRKAIHFRDAPG